MGNQQTIYIGEEFSILGPHLLGTHHAIRIVFIKSYSPKGVDVLNQLISSVVFKGFVYNLIRIRRINNAEQISGSIVGHLGNLAVFVGDLCGFVKTVVNSRGAIAQGVGFLSKIAVAVVSVGGGVTIFIGIIGQLAERIDGALALVIVSIGGNTNTIAVFKQCGGRTKGIYLLTNTAKTIIGVLEIADAVSIGTGLNSAVDIIGKRKLIAIDITDLGQIIILIAQGSHPPGFILDADNLPRIVLDKEDAFVGNAIGDNHTLIMVGNVSFKSVMIHDFDQSTFGVIVFMFFVIAIQTITFNAFG